MIASWRRLGEAQKLNSQETGDIPTRLYPLRPIWSDVCLYNLLCVRAAPPDASNRELACHFGKGTKVREYRSKPPQTSLRPRQESQIRQWVRTCPGQIKLLLRARGLPTASFHRRLEEVEALTRRRTHRLQTLLTAPRSSFRLSIGQFGFELEEVSNDFQMRIAI